MMGSDQRLEIAMGHMLRIGVTVAAIVVLTGGILYLSRPSGPVPDYSHFNGAPAADKHIVSIFTGALRFNSSSLIELGILLLIATPVLRVLLGFIGFVLMKDWLYAGVGALVLIILALCFISRT
jgi:uncharacterized membrane protein